MPEDKLTEDEKVLIWLLIKYAIESELIEFEDVQVESRRFDTFKIKFRVYEFFHLGHIEDLKKAIERAVGLIVPYDYDIEIAFWEVSVDKDDYLYVEVDVRVDKKGDADGEG